MSNNRKSTGLIVLALLIGISGLGLATYSTFFQQTIAAPAEDASGGLLIGILNPDQQDVVSGVIEIKALIGGSNQYSISVLRNATEIGTQVPLIWNTTLVADGWWNITIRVIDIPSGKEIQDGVIVYVQNNIEDNPVYYCESEGEINDALADIGTGKGTITITDDIILNSSISINGGGSYIIQGVAPEITIDCNGDRSALRVEVIESCIIRDLTIDATNITGTTTRIIYASDSYIYIENVRILGDSDRRGRGIYIDSYYVWVTNCYIREVLYGIYGYTGAHYAHISDNTVLYSNDGSVGVGIYLRGDYSICESNYVAHCNMGIYCYGYQSMVSNNVLYGNPSYGIYVYTIYSNFDGNSIRSYNQNSANYLFAIYIGSGSDYNVFTGNLIYGYINTGSGTGYGIYIISSTCDENTIVGNTILSCDTAIYDLGTNSYISNNNIS